MSPHRSLLDASSILSCTKKERVKGRKAQELGGERSLMMNGISNKQIKFLRFESTLALSSLSGFLPKPRASGNNDVKKYVRRFAEGERLQLDIGF